MLIRRFKLKEHEDFGSNGWLMVGAPDTYVPLSGMAVAHDLLEHRRNDQGTVEDELLAFGAVLYIRGEGGYWARKGSPYQPGYHLGGEIGNDLGVKYGGVENRIQDPGRTRPLEEHVEEWIAEAIAEARSALKECCNDFTFKQVEEFLSRAVGWIRRGYRMALKRYHGIPVCNLAYLYAQIEEKADRLLKDDMAQYCEMVIRLDPRKCNVQVYLDESGLYSDEDN
jgi:hypothetical protein